jgi:hypothetical protein
MTSRISHTSFDAINAYAQSVFWSQVLGFAEDPDDPNEPGHEECLIMSRDRSQLLLFITVPDGSVTVLRTVLSQVRGSLALCLNRAVVLTLSLRPRLGRD